MIREVTNRRALAAMIGILTSTALTAAEIVAGANYLSTDRDITDHADAPNSGSLAWWAAKAVKSPATEMEVVVLGPHTYTIGSDLRIPRNLTLRVRRGAILNVKDGVTLTINGGIAAGPWRVFAKTGTVDGDMRVDFVRPQWWGIDTAALQAAVKFKRVHLGRGTFTIDKRVLIGSDTHITGEPGCLVTSTRRGLNVNEGMFTNWPVGGGGEPVRNVTIDGVRFSNSTSTGLFGLTLFSNGGTNENIRFVNCEAIGCGLLWVSTVKNILVNDNLCHQSNLAREEFADIAGVFTKYDNQGGIYLSGSVADAVICNNRILGPRCHGIMVVSQGVYKRTYEERDPNQDFAGKRILIQGNEVKSKPNKFCAGGIFVGFVQDCRIIGNHVEGYNDVGIDFEGSRNCIADSNIVIDNGKSLALYGNNKNITLSNNIVQITKDNDNPFFMNMYSNSGNDPPITDLRQTDIFVTGNTFYGRMKSCKKSWTGAIVPGTARRLYIRNNNFINARFQAQFCDDLETIEVTGNSFYNELPDTGAVVYLAVSERNKKTKQPTKNFIISGNHFRSVNDAGTSSIIAVDSTGGTEGVAPHCDLNVVITDNIIDRETTEGNNAIQFRHNYDWGYADSMRINCIIKNNVTNSDIGIRIPEKRRKAVNLVVEGNTKMIPPGPKRGE